MKWQQKQLLLPYETMQLCVPVWFCMHVTKCACFFTVFNPVFFSPGALSPHCINLLHMSLLLRGMGWILLVYTTGCFPHFIIRSFNHVLQKPLPCWGLERERGMSVQYVVWGHFMSACIHKHASSKCMCIYYVRLCSECFRVAPCGGTYNSLMHHVGILHLWVTWLKREWIPLRHWLVKCSWAPLNCIMFIDLCREEMHIPSPLYHGWGSL